MASTAPLHSVAGKVDEESSTSPEALLISSMLEIGSFDPARYHVADDDIEAWKKLWLFACNYQTISGVAPPMSIIRAKFREFELTSGVSPEWAANKVLEASASRQLRIRSKAMLYALSEDDIDAAFTAIEGVQRPRAHRKAPSSVFDHAMLADKFQVSRIEVPYPTLERATQGGIGPGELWYLAARLGQGKSWELMGYAAKAALCGYKVGIASLEMPASKVIRRALLRMVGNKDTYLSEMIDSPDQVQRKKAMDIIAGRTTGTIEVLDPSHGRINTTTSINEMCSEGYDLVVIDHAGLLMTSDGRRAIDDWRAMAAISNVLREITLATGTSILAAAQINREGEHGNKDAPPKVSQLSQSDALGQDADVVITMRRQSDRIMVNEAGKVREGPSLRWWTHFDPAKNQWGEVSAAQAEEIKANDQDRLDARLVVV